MGTSYIMGQLEYISSRLNKIGSEPIESWNDYLYGEDAVLTEDANGHIWICTHQGNYTFDMKRFKHLKGY